MRLLGSGTADADSALTSAKSVPATSNEPDEGVRSTEMDPEAVNAVPSDSMKLVGFKVAVNRAEVKLSVLGNCTIGLPKESSNSPGPISPKLMSCEEPPWKY